MRARATKEDCGKCPKCGAKINYVKANILNKRDIERLNKMGINVLPDGRMKAPDVAKYIGCAVVTVYRRLQGIKQIKLGGKVFYGIKDVDKFIRDNKR